MAEPIPPLRQLKRFARRHGWLVVLVTVLALLVAAAAVRRQQPVYRASMGIVVAQASGPYLSPLGNQPLSQTISSILESDVVARAVVRDLHLKISSGALLKKLNVTLKPDSSVLEVTYDSHSRTRAVAVLTAVQAAFEHVVGQTLGVSTSLKKKGPLLLLASVFDPPHLHAQPVAPRRGKILGFAGVLGLFLGLILAYARSSLDDRIHEPEDAQSWFGAPLIVTLPRDFAKAGAAQSSRVQEEVLALLSANMQLRYQRLGPTVLVTSANDDAATAALVATLGLALARSGENVVCVDTNFRGPRLGPLLHRNGAADAGAGLKDVLDGTLPLDRALIAMDVRPSTNGAKRETDAGRLALLPSGPSPVDPTTTLAPRRISEVVSALSETADYVLVDSPSLLSAPQAVSFAAAVDGVVVVAHLGETRRGLAQDVRAALEEIGVRNVAVVLTRRRALLRRLRRRS